MLDDTIRAFLLAARLGSFSQAARELYLTPNAVKKRVEALERQTGLTLFERSNHGLVLTPAGTSLATDLRSVSRQLERAVADARAIQERRAGTVWLGISATFAEELLSSRWPGVEHFVGATATRIVHYGPTPRDRDEMLRDVGVRTDLCVDLFEPQLAPVNGLRAWEISRFRLYLASVDTDREVGGDLELANVSTRAVALLPIGRSRAVDAVRRRLARERMDIELIDLLDYDVRTLDELRGQSCAVVAPENVAALYPHLSFRPLAGTPPVSFGVYGTPEPSEASRALVANLLGTRNF